MYHYLKMERINLSAAALGWVGLAIFLFFTSFGFTGGVCLILYLMSFLTGFLAMLYYYGKQKTEEWLQSSKHLTFPLPSVGLPKIVENVRKGRPPIKSDRRMTGSNLIDEVLHEVLDYSYRDYIHVWYKKISDDEEQFRHDVRQTMQRVIIAFSERSKRVKLVDYLTTRLVDDFASHIRLYRRALDRVREHEKDDTKPPADLESIFFDLETEMENNMCRDMICMDEDSERQYLQDLSEVLLFLLLPPEDFHNKPFRYIVREVLVNAIFIPAMNQVSDPDYINQTINWLCKDSHFTSESFITILKTSDNMEELQAIKEKVDVDILRQRSKDTGGDDDTVIKQQLSSLMFVKNVCETRIQQLKDGLDANDTLLPGGWDIKQMLAGQKLYSLQFDVVLNNNVALAYFIEFMTNIGAQGYLFFYLTIEGYRVSAEQQISAALLAENSNEKPDLEMLREAAISIYQQYLSDKASPRLKLEENIIRDLWDRINEDEPSDTIFNEAQARVWDLLQEEPYFPAFKKSQLYIKLLAELDLLKDLTKSEEGLMPDEDAISGSSKSSSLQASQEDLASSCDSLSSAENGGSFISRSSPYTLTAHITNTVAITSQAELDEFLSTFLHCNDVDLRGICKEHGNAYAIYMIKVTKTNVDGSEDTWDVYRRYSDFHDLHMTIQEKFDSLGGVTLPKKKAFNNMNKDFLEKRRVGLNAYLQALLNPSVLNSHRGLLEMVFQFLEHMVWEKEKSSLTRKMDTIVNPLKLSVRNVGNMVKSMPDNFVDGVAKVSGGIRSIPTNMLDGVGKMLNVKGLRRKSTSFQLCNNLFTDWLPFLPPAGIPGTIRPDLLTDTAKVGASLYDEDDQDNIPLRIMLLLMDEVFDLKTRNQWLRRRIVTILRQIVKAMMGDSINRKIVDHVEWMTSAEQIAEYVKNFRDSFWPNGIPAESQPPREEATKQMTRVVAKTKMLSGISEEILHLIGRETTRHGTIRVFNMFQHPCLNKRLIYVILEGMLETIFPDNKFPEVLRKMHSRSPRVKKGQPSPELKVPLKKRQSIKR